MLEALWWFCLSEPLNFWFNLARVQCVMSFCLASYSICCGLKKQGQILRKKLKAPQCWLLCVESNCPEQCPQGSLLVHRKTDTLIWSLKLNPSSLEMFVFISLKYLGFVFCWLADAVNNLYLRKKEKGGVVGSGGVEWRRDQLGHGFNSQSGFLHFHWAYYSCWPAWWWLLTDNLRGF